MHEFSMTSMVVDTVIRAAEVHKASKVKEVKLVIGKLSLLNIDQIKFSYKVLSEGTLLEGSRLLVEEKEAKVKCERCGHEGPLDHLENPSYHFILPTLQCPRCKGTVTIVEGNECTLKTIKLEI